jgi:hypothetical protein
MARSPRVGRFKIKIERRWDIADLQEFSDSLVQTYGFLYQLEGWGGVPLSRSKFVFPDDWPFQWGHFFYREVPPKQRIKIKSFHYSSPGVIEIVAILSLLGLAARVVRAWARTGDAVLALLEKVKKFLSQRSRSRQEPAITHDLVFQFGLSLGLNEEDCATLIKEAGTIGALKLLVAVATQGQRLAQLEQQGKLVFAEAASSQRQLPPPRGGSTEEAANTQEGCAIERPRCGGCTTPPTCSTRFSVACRHAGRRGWQGAVELKPAQMMLGATIGGTTIILLLPTLAAPEQHTWRQGRWTGRWIGTQFSLAFWWWSLAGLFGWDGDKYRRNAPTLVLCPAGSPPQPAENCLPT